MGGIWAFHLLIALTVLLLVSNTLGFNTGRANSVRFEARNDDDGCDDSPDITYSEEDGKTCDASQKAIIETEMTTAIAMANAAKASWTKDGFADLFFAQSVMNQDNFNDIMQDTLTRVASLLDGSASYAVTVSCDTGASSCKKGFPAFMSQQDGSHGTLNFCDGFFASGNQIRPTADNINQCKTGSIDLRAAQRSRASILVHESIHTSYAMRDDSPGLDYAYGITAALKLPKGTFDRRCPPGPNMRKLTGGKPLCGPDPNNKDGEDGICAPSLCIRNPDSWSLVATGIYFSDQCGKQVPLPADLTKRRENISARASTQPQCQGDGTVDFIPE